MTESGFSGQDFALVTGGARRLGRAIVEGLVEVGTPTLIHANRSVEEAQQLAQALSSNENCIALGADLADGTQLEAFVELVLKQYGPPKYLVLSAASFMKKTLAETSVAEWDAVHALNLRAPVMLASRFGKAMTQAGGSIVLIADAAGLVPWPNYAAHSIAKGALLPALRILAKDMAPHVTVNAVAPGPVLFPEHYDDTAKQAAVARTVLQRAGSPDDVVRAVRFLCFDAPYVTGAVLPVDGGRHLGW